jgi:hypothetical protein
MSLFESHGMPGCAMHYQQPSQQSVRYAKRVRVMDGLRGIRPIERFAYELTRHHPLPPRPYKTWMFLRHCLWSKMTVAITMLLVLISIMLLRYRGDFAADWFFFVYIGCAVIGIIGYGWVYPIWRWRRALQIGRCGIATITQVQLKQLKNGVAVTVCWTYPTANMITETKYRFPLDDTGDWVAHVQAGSRIHVLLHPIKPVVLAALGPETPAIIR